MWHYGVDVTYPRLTDWTCLQWAFHDCTACSTCSWRVHFLCEGGDAALFKLLLGFLLEIYLKLPEVVMVYINLVNADSAPGDCKHSYQTNQLGL